MYTLYSSPSEMIRQNSSAENLSANHLHWLLPD